MAEIVGGLFGVTPESLMAQREAALSQQAQQFAQLSPMQAAQAGFYTAGNRLAGAAGGLMGAQDPEMMRIQQRQSMLQGLDLTSPESLKQGIQTAMQNKDYQLVSELTNRYQQSTAAALKARETEANIGAKLGEKLTTEQKNAAGLADAAGLQRGTQEWQTAYGKALKGLTDKNEPTSVVETADGVFLVNKLTGEKISRVGSAPERGNKTTVNVDAKGEAEFVKELGKLDAKRVNDALTTRETATSALNSLNKLATLPSDQLITGQFATGRVGATNLLTTLGLASPSDAQKLATSQQYQKVAGDVILQTLGGKLGAGFSNADREFIASLVPQLETNPEARRSLIQFMQAKNQDVIKEATRLETYARQNKGLSGFTPNIPMSVTPTGQYSGLSDAELAARIKAAQANQKR
jgi:hypothetical protein